MKFTRITSHFIVVMLFTLLLSCNSDDEPEQVQPLDNPSVENGNQSPYNWFQNQGSYVTEWSDEQAFDGGRSLKISSDNDFGPFGYWGQTIAEGIPYGEKLRFSCQIKLEGVIGEGVSIALRGDSETGGVFFYSTQGDDYIAGDEGWQRYSVEMTQETVSEEVTKLLVFVIMLSNTEGEVYFDDFKLSPI